MALQLPVLDNRTYDELVAEGRRLIPRHAPGWTDHNASDPGITLLELFAWLTETSIYRLDRLSEASYRSFLHLLGFDPLPNRIARAPLQFRVISGGAGIELPAGVTVENTSGSIVFQTTRPLFVSPARLESVQAASDNDRLEVTGANRTSGVLFEPFSARPSPGDALYLGFDGPLGNPGHAVDLYLWTGDYEADLVERDRLIDEHGEAVQAEPKNGRPALAPDWRYHYSAKTIWEYFTAAGDWALLGGVIDETRALSMSGFIRFEIPKNHAPNGSGRYFIRCRLMSGRFECAPSIDRIALNVVEIEHAVDEEEVWLGMSDGSAGQTFILPQTPIVAGSSRLRLVNDVGEALDWQEASNWDQAGPHDRVYILDSNSGKITFGDGRVGRVPADGVEVYAQYRVGGGAAGNVPAGGLTRLSMADASIAAQLEVWQPVAALGGAEAETLADAQGRAVASLRRRSRAVTLGDFATLALETPGVPVARAHALPRYHPSVPCVKAAGCVTVVAVPSCPDPAPKPGCDFLDAIHRYLEPRRPLTTEVHVIGPAYTYVAVHATLHVEPGSSMDASEAGAALDAFFHPLTGGPDADGWPVGRSVYRSEVLAILQALPGVRYVDGFSLETADGRRCEIVSLCPDSLVEAGRHRITINSNR